MSEQTVDTLQERLHQHSDQQLAERIEDMFRQMKHRLPSHPASYELPLLKQANGEKVTLSTVITMAEGVVFTVEQQREREKYINDWMQRVNRMQAEIDDLRAELDART